MGMGFGRVCGDVGETHPHPTLPLKGRASGCGRGGWIGQNQGSPTSGADHVSPPDSLVLRNRACLHLLLPLRPAFPSVSPLYVSLPSIIRSFSFFRHIPPHPFYLLLPLLHPLLLFLFPLPF